mmetsp:Transcript_64105/g.206492  ORF Transcript_64105/g.206492 Transcript_64105/m.206492 type:complete len:287 (+) Transcript_64105:879-1739(+)
MHSRYGQAFHHSPQPLLEPLLVRNGACGVWCDVAQEVIYLGHDAAGSHVHARPLLADLEVALHDHEEGRADGQRHEQQVQGVLEEGHLLRELPDLLPADGEPDEEHRDEGAEHHRKGDEHGRAHHEPAELLLAPHEPEVQGPAPGDEGAVDHRGVGLPQPRLAGEHRHQLGDHALRGVRKGVDDADHLPEGMGPALQHVQKADDVAQCELLAGVHAGAVEVVLDVLHDLAGRQGLHDLHGRGRAREPGAGRVVQEGPAARDGRAVPDLLHDVDEEANLLRHVRRVV